MEALWPLVFSVVGTLFSLLATALMGMALGKLNSIEMIQRKQGDQVLTHVTASNVHESGLVRLEEQIKNVLQLAKIAHERADRIEADLRVKG